jgi:hypothetical protein
MEHLKTPPLTTSKEIFVVTGITGLGFEKSSWLVNAYSTSTGADKARTFLQREADKIDVAPIEDTHNAINNLKLFDPLAWYDEGILYTVEKVTYVV